MKNTNDSPGVFIPPPLFYALIFLVAVLVQKRIPIPDAFFHSWIAGVAGVIFLALSLFFLVSSLMKFLRSKNTLMLIRPASSLQTNGIYSVSRNPMYLGLGLIYLGLTGLIGNWWNIIFLPILLMIVQEFIIKKEESYLKRAFGDRYLAYMNTTRRWI